MFCNVTGECKFLIASYLHCLKSAGGVNDESCRKLAKGYLGCRMDKCVLSELRVGILRGKQLAVFWLLTGLHDRNLMAPDDFKNLGLVFDEDKNTSTNGGGTATAASSNSTTKQ